MALLSVGACQSKKPIAYIDFVVARPGDYPIDRAQGTNLLRTHAQRIQGFSLRSAGKNEAPWQLTVEVMLATERAADHGPQEVRRGLGLAGELKTLDRSTSYLAEVLEIRNMAPGSSVEPLLHAALTALMARIETSIRLETASDGVLAAALRGSDDHARAEAIRMIHARQRGALGPELETLLRAPSTSVQEAVRVASALVALKRPEFANAIIETISRHPSATVPLIFLLGQLGGTEAEAYLFTLQSGHPDPQIQAAAREAMTAVESAGRQQR